MIGRVTAAVALAAIAFGCSNDNPRVGGKDGDPRLFAEEVQPILERRCGFLGCHGREGMPLTIYGLDYLRMRDPEGFIDETRPVLDERALADAELAHNRRAIAARIDEDDPEGTRFIRRLLPPEQGGIPHADVVVYDSEDDPEVQVLQRFIETVHDQQ